MITDYEQSTDEDLCRMHVDGDDLAFEQLYKKHLKYCMNYVMSKNVGYLDAEECVQKAFSKSVVKIKDLRDFVKENSYEETAKILNIPQGTVMSRMHYSRKKFVDIYNRELKKEKAKEADLLILKLNAS